MPFGRTMTACDCWGLVRLVYLERLGFEVPMYDREYARLMHSLDDVAQHLGWVEVATPTDLCAVAMSGRGVIMHHVGIYLDVDGGKVLHAVKPFSGIQKLSDLPKHGYHTFKFYEYRKQPAP